MTVLNIGDILNPAGYTPERMLERLDSLPVGTVAVDPKTEETITKSNADLYKVIPPAMSNGLTAGLAFLTGLALADKIARVGIQELLNAPVYKINELPEQERAEQGK